MSIASSQPPVDRTPRPPQADRDPASRWRPWSALIALVGGVAGGLVVLALVAAIAAAAGVSPSRQTAAEDLIVLLGQDLGFVGVSLWLAHGVAPVRPWQFGLRRPAVLPALGLVVGGYVLFALLSNVWARALHLDQPDKLPQMLGAGRSTLALVCAAVLTCVVAPICEEFLFRGYMFRALRNWRGVWPAALIVGLAFGAVHVGSAPAGDLVPLGAFGVLLCVIYQRTRSLYPCIALHCVNNCIAFAGIEHAASAWYPALIVGGLAAVGGLLAAAVRWWPGQPQLT
jgi:membrane protease YdiL (CAAX protease family)